MTAPSGYSRQPYESSSMNKFNGGAAARNRQGHQDEGCNGSIKIVTGRMCPRLWRLMLREGSLKFVSAKSEQSERVGAMEGQE